MMEVLQFPSPSSCSSSPCARLNSNDAPHQTSLLNNNDQTETVIHRFQIQQHQQQQQQIQDKERERDQLSILTLLIATFRKSLIGCSTTASDIASSMEIGWPSNVRHVAHVTFDRFHGFLGLPVEFEPEVPRRPPSARFSQVAKLHIVCWFDIHGMISMRDLSPNTQYAAYLVFKLINASGFRNPDSPVEISVGVEGGHRSTKTVYLDPNVEDRSHSGEVGLRQPSVRNDGWLEIEIGEFFNSGLEDEEVQMNVKETNDYTSKMGLFVEGIEVRPK